MTSGKYITLENYIDKFINDNPHKEYSGITFLMEINKLARVNLGITLHAKLINSFPVLHHEKNDVSGYLRNHCIIEKADPKIDRLTYT